MVGVVAQDVQIDRLATKPLAHPILTEVLAVRTDQQREITQLLAELTHLRLSDASAAGHHRCTLCTTEVPPGYPQAARNCTIDDQVGHPVGCVPSFMPPRISCWAASVRAVAGQGSDCVWGALPSSRPIGRD